MPPDCTWKRRWRRSAVRATRWNSWTAARRGWPCCITSPGGARGWGAEPGSVPVLRGPAIDGLRVQRSTTAHEGNALELLATARLLGDDAGGVVVVGVEP